MVYLPWFHSGAIVSASPQALVLVVSQIRLRVGPFIFVPARPDPNFASTQWAIPGRTVATYHQLTCLARYHEWGKPRPIRVTVKYRAPDAQPIEPSQVQA